LSVRQLDDDLAGPHQLQLFARSTFDLAAIVLKSLDGFTVTLVIGERFIDFLVELFQFLTPFLDREGTALIKYGEQKHRNREQSEDANGDPRYQTLH
jgi:hypothetical protein